MAIWQDLVSEMGSAAAIRRVKRFVRKLRGNQPLQPRAVILTAPGEEAQVDYGTGPMVRDPQTRQISTHAIVRDDARLQPQGGTLSDLPFQFAHLGRTTRESVSSTGWQLRASSCSIICAKACSSPTSTIPL